jgi:hypothetical protein
MQKIKYWKYVQILAARENQADWKILLGPKKIRRIEKSLRPEKIRPIGKSLRPEKIRPIEKSFLQLILHVL